MNKMTIIQLLNKIANGEVPKKIKWNDYIYEKSKYNATPRGYYYRINGGIKLWFLDEINDLNDEVEIIEEEKKIPEKLDIRQEKNIKNNWKWKVYGKEHSYNISTPQKIIADKVNEICDYLKSKGE